MKMTEGEQRRQEILKTLAGAHKPVSASKFAERFGVSRQIVVGDIALLRAAGEEIIATARGYLLESSETTTGFLSKIAVQHSNDQIEEELMLIIQHGGQIVDVIIEHPLYGQIVGMLHIENEKDVANFMKKFQESNALPLSELTCGIHLHTIRYQEEHVLKKIKQALAEAGILYEG